MNNWLIYGYQSNWHEDRDYVRGCINLNNVVKFVDYIEHVDGYKKGDTIMSVYAVMQVGDKEYTEVIFKHFGSMDNAYEESCNVWSALGGLLLGQGVSGVEWSLEVI